MLKVLNREWVYIFYYFEVQLGQIFRYWVLGMLIGSAVSVFMKDRLHGALLKLREQRLGIWEIVPACILGILSPLCMYGTIPIAASFHEGFGVLMAATIGVPLYACGGGTIPFLQQWLASGMSMGSASAFMITGPATKITNLGALKICLGKKHFVLYLAFVMAFSFLCGMVTNGIWRIWGLAGG